MERRHEQRRQDDIERDESFAVCPKFNSHSTDCCLKDGSRCDDLHELESDVRKMEANLEETLPQISATLKMLSDQSARQTETLNKMAEILEAWNSIKGFGKTLGYIAAAIKVAAVIAIAWAAIVFFLRTGQIPK